MKEFNPINLESKSEKDLEQIVKEIKKEGTISLLSSRFWYDEIEKNGEIVDIYEGMSEYQKCFDKIKLKLSNILKEKPKLYDWKDKIVREKYFVDIVAIWENKNIALLYSHEDKELPIEIILKKE